MPPLQLIQAFFQRTARSSSAQIPILRWNTSVRAPGSRSSLDPVLATHQKNKTSLFKSLKKGSSYLAHKRLLGLRTAIEVLVTTWAGYKTAMICHEMLCNLSPENVGQGGEDGEEKKCPRVGLSEEEFRKCLISTP